jgi:hypothetical protein
MENSIRFILEPRLAGDYVYIGDVDIMILENIWDWHKPVFDAGLPYSNVIRLGKKKLTGLHFVKRDRYYPIPVIDDLIKSIENDEELLYEINKRSGLLYDEKEYNKIRQGRPIHGLHMSLNRLPFSYEPERVGWNMSFKNLEKFGALIKTEIFNDFFKTLYPGSSQILLNLIFLSHGAMGLGKAFWMDAVKPKSR